MRRRRSTRASSGTSTRKGRIAASSDASEAARAAPNGPRRSCAQCGPLSPFPALRAVEELLDRVAASKRKGIWMGGVVPLGYRVEDRALHVVEDEAEFLRRAGFIPLAGHAGRESPSRLCHGASRVCRPRLEDFHDRRCN